MKTIKFSCVALIFLASQSFGQGNPMIFSIRSRVFHPNNEKDTLSTLRAAEYFGVKQVDWMYCADIKKLNQLKDEGIKYSLAINPQIPDSLQYTTTKYRIKDIFGRPYVAPRMKTWKVTNPYWGCVNNPGFKTLFFDRSKKLIELGAYGIVVDDAMFNVKLQRDKPNNYGCFCDYCLRGFSTYLKDVEGINMSPEEAKQRFRDMFARGDTAEAANRKLLTSYELYQEASVVKFFDEWRHEMKKTDPQIVLMTNNANGTWNDIYSIFDSGIAELNPTLLGNLDRLYAEADKMGKSQLFTLTSTNLDDQYYLLVYNFLNKRKSIAPWDVYAGGSDNKKFSASLRQTKFLTDFFADCDTNDITGKLTKHESGFTTFWSATVRKKSGGSLVVVLSSRKNPVIQTEQIKLPMLSGKKSVKRFDTNGLRNRYGVQIFDVK